MMDVDPVPPAYAPLTDRHGPPLGVEEARTRWGALVRAAQEGRTTLITRERWEWAALVPLAEVTGPMTGLPAWPLSGARAKLGDLVRHAADRAGGTPLLLTRHRTPIAALIAANQLITRPAHGDRLDADALLYDGCEITLRFDPGQTGRADESGDTLDEPTDPCYVATARDRRGEVVATGAGDSIAEALLCLTPPHRPAPGEPADEPPF
ncbi:hypothetical protein ACFV0L_42715 [Streptosporangium canum]|uniref:hypothetical protein n=1 Tax=Streptosporangium canum TaxID=324952 RepID=UPI00367DFBB4